MVTQVKTFCAEGCWLIAVCWFKNAWGLWLVSCFFVVAGCLRCSDGYFFVMLMK